MQKLRLAATIDGVMKLMFFLSMAYFAGIEGFGLFTAYLALVLSVHVLLKKRRNRPPVQPAPAMASGEALLLADVR